MKTIVQNRGRTPLRLAVLASAFAFQLAAPGLAMALQRECPHHEAHGAMDPLAASNPSADVHGHAGADSGDHTAPSACTCLGSCLGGSATLPPIGSGAAVAAIQPIVVSTVPVSEAPTLRSDPYTLPFANGPPSLDTR